MYRETPHPALRNDMRASLCALAAAHFIVGAAHAIGINLGNVLEAPKEGNWAAPAQAYYFDDYKSAGFSFVRIPVRWNNHTQNSAPYIIDASFLARVAEVSRVVLLLSARARAGALL